MRLRTPEYYTFSETITSNTIFIEMLPCFQVNFSMKLSKKNASSEMEFNSRLDDKNRDACPKSTKLQSVTPQYRFYFQKIF